MAAGDLAAAAAEESKWDATTWRGGGFGSSSRLRGPPVQLSDCRELVEVPGGASWKLRKFMDEFPVFCWQLPSASTSIQYEFETVATAVKDQEYVGPSHQPLASLPVFYALLPHCYSPLDFSVQPRHFQRVRIKLEENMAEVYGSESTPEFTVDQVFAGVPCAVLFRDTWLRARIIRVAASSTVMVRLVDVGLDVFVERGTIRPLLRHFGRIPPLALVCKVKNVCVNDLEQWRVDAFKQLLLETCRGMVRVELTTLDEPFIVNLYHPIIEGENLGTQFYRPAEALGIEERRQRRFLAHVRRVQNEESDFDDEEEYEDEEGMEQAPLFVRKFDPAPKVTRFLDQTLFSVTSVASVRMICLQTEQQLKAREECEEKIGMNLHNLPRLPRSWLEAGTACAASKKGWRLPRRAAVDEVDGEDVMVLLVDYGDWFWTKAELLRALPEEFSFCPQVCIVSLYNPTCYLHPHPTETRILRFLLSQPGAVKFEREPSKRNPPTGHIVHERYGDINGEIKIRLADYGVIHPCTTLAFPSPIASLLRHAIDVVYRHVLQPPAYLLRGAAQFEELPPAIEEEEDW